MKPDQQHSFWISYSDLATGLMMVFLLLMVMLWKQTQEEKERAQAAEQQAKDRVATLVETSTRHLEKVNQFAKRIQDGMDGHLVDGVQVDPFTGQLIIGSEAIGFDSGKATLNAKGRKALEAFAPRYMCLLWQEDGKGSPSFVNPYRSDVLVQQVTITGHADLQDNDETVPGGLNQNQSLGSARANTVAGFVSQLLRDCAQRKSRCKPELFAGEGRKDKRATTCAAGGSALWRYVQERLRVSGAGHVEHCIEKREQGMLSGGCEDRNGSAENGEHRFVGFHLVMRELDLSEQLIGISASELADDKCDSLPPWHVGALSQLAKRCRKAQQSGRARDVPLGCTALDGKTTQLDCNSTCGTLGVIPRCLE